MYTLLGNTIYTAFIRTKTEQGIKEWETSFEKY